MTTEPNYRRTKRDRSSKRLARLGTIETVAFYTAGITMNRALMESYCRKVTRLVVEYNPHRHRTHDYGNVISVVAWIQEVNDLRRKISRLASRTERYSRFMRRAVSQQMSAIPISPISSVYERINNRIRTAITLL